MIVIANDDLRIEIATLGAEMQRLQDSSGADYLWNGDPAFWKGRAPLLFPMVGRAHEDRIRIDGRTYPLPQHGLARISEFSVVETQSSACTLRMTANETTLAAWPFRFRLDMTYALDGATLAMTATVVNEDDKPIPVSFGFHPAFRWPLPGASRDEHALEFERTEPAPIRRLIDGYLAPDALPSPVAGRTLALRDDLFDDGAIVFDRIDSRRARLVAPGARAVEVAFPDMPHLGVWTKPGAPFVCIEPWQGFAAPLGFDGEFAMRPGVVALQVGEARRFAMSVTLD